MRRKNGEKKVRTTPVCLPPDLIRQLDQFADQEGIFGRSAVIRLACRQFLNLREVFADAEAQAEGGATR